MSEIFAFGSGHSAGTGGARATTWSLGPWQVVGLAGSGQWTDVFRARPAASRPDQPADYAIKCLKGEFELRPEYVGLLKREAHVGRAIADRHLAPVLASSLKQPPYWLAMPLLAGQTLDALLASRRRLPAAQGLWIARQVAEALHALHLHGWMHGDVKPRNIFVSPQGHATLIDLGFARPTNQLPEGLSLEELETTLSATPAYAAPETFRDPAQFLPAGDLYSLGVTLFEILTGRRPFHSTSPIVLADSHLRLRPPDVRQFVPDTPAKVADLVWQLLAKTPECRPTGERLLDQLVSLEIETFERGVA